MHRLLPVVRLLPAVLLLSACLEPLPEGTGALEDPGNYATGERFAQCAVGPGTPCTPEGFDLSACATSGSFEAFGAGTFTTQSRWEYSSGGVAFGVGGLRTLGSAASGELLMGRAVAVRQVGAQGFFVSTAPDSRGRIYAVAGCGAPPSASELRGCIQYCSQTTGENALLLPGTFRAQRVEQWPGGEAEAEGLELVAEVPASRAGNDIPADVYVTKGHAYVVTLYGGLFVYDVRDPARPVLRKNEYLSTDNYWNSAWAKDDALYVGSATSGVRVYDLSDPANPVFLRALASTRTNVHTLFVEGERLYTTEYIAAADGPVERIAIWDVKDAKNPSRLGSYVSPARDPSWSTGLHDMFALGDRLYVSYWSLGYEVVNVADPANPTLLGDYRYPHATSHASAVMRYGDKLVAFEGGEDWGAHLRVLDVTDPADIRKIGEYSLGDHLSVHNFVLRDGKLYVSYYQRGVRVLDVGVPFRPRELAHFNTWREGDRNRGASFYDGAIGMRVPGDGYVYAVDTSRGLLVLREKH